MPVIRTEKKNNYTVVDNGFLRDQTLSLKARGLMATMLSLPEDWNYSVRGLAAICKESIHTVRAILLELEEHGYLIRKTYRNIGGKYSTEYVICETPKSESQTQNTVHGETVSGDAESGNTVTGNTVTENTVSVITVPDNCPQLNKEKRNKDILNTEVSTTYPINPILYTEEDKPTDSMEAGQDGYDPMALLNPTGDSLFEDTGASPGKEGELPFTELGEQAPPPQEEQGFYWGGEAAEAADCRPQREETGAFRCQPPRLSDPWSIVSLQRIIEANVERDVLAQEPGFDTAQLDELILLAAQAAASKRPTQNIGGEPIPTELVRSRMLSLRASHMEYVIECLERYGADIHNVRRYLTAALFNAPATIDSYYNAKYRRDQCLPL